MKVRKTRCTTAGLDAARRRELLKTLTRGALAAGFATELWTLARVGALIERRFGRRYSENQVSRILLSLGFSYQRASSKALERDEAAEMPPAQPRLALRETGEAQTP